MQSLLFYLQLTLSILVIVMILVQARGKGLSSTFGGSSSSSFSRRGLEKWLFKATFFVVAFFVVLSVVSLI